ncbi:probable protein S-acyltransferase 19 isoform X2 [Aegilops tauschii subsp. strangulata]|uniref:S-acyltransferase n=2 Tax=Aegilops tauschii subsp. strangulata TaxID=200361 RepID=A0A453RRY6_AEGTS|nr:probable protein S-acyltransferase 19 isoform X2 [Aegilops tauschii subsp. strangulata]
MPMVRKHGWQLPAHTFQIVAITVFFLLVVAFYAFFAPFLGKQILEYVAVGIYTPVAFAVFILYIRCTSINPADPGIMSKFDDGHVNAPESNTGLQGTNMPAKTGIDINIRMQPLKRRSGCYFGGFICAFFVKEDCRKSDDSENQVDAEDALFCTLCNAEVRKFSKHCRSCDKCVDGFDHHCRWLNNCVGRKNYFTFFALMTTSLLWLAIEVGVGIAVLVMCFANTNAEKIIQDKLGNGLTRLPFATIVGIFTLLSLVACVPLGELFFFHMLLIRKGITTYEYVVAMRAMSEVPQDEEEDERANIIYSPTNSATSGFSGGSSLGLHYKGAWCTPPRIFVDQDEVIPHLERGMAPSTVDPDATGHAERPNKAKRQVKISAWKLAKLDGNEAMKAAARARASSSVLRPVGARGPGSTGNSHPQSIASQDDYETGTQSASSLSSPVHIHKLAPRTQMNVPPPRPPEGPGFPTTQATTNPIMFRSATSYARENRRASVVWDQDAGRYVSVASAPARPVGAAAGSSTRAPRFLENPSGGRNLAPMSAASSALPSGQPSERLAYSGQSIFLGGPVLGAAAESRTNEANTRARPDDSGELNADQHHARGSGERGPTAESFPAGTFQKKPPFNR